MKNYLSLYIVSIFSIALCSCKPSQSAVALEKESYSTWDNAIVYFLLTDRFNDGNPSNNYQHTTDNPPAPYRGFMGGDIKGITQKINDNYFSNLGVTALWMTPVVEQIKGSVDEGTGNSFAFHGYWTRDWTALDPRFGTEEDLMEMVQAAHSKNIRVLIDVVANHTGPVTELDSKWPDDWVKTGPRCTYQSAETTINCTLVDNLPDIRTESDKQVSIPPFLEEKWRSEGRYEKEMAELEQWFQATGHPKTAVNYILKWLVDFIKKYGIDGFRVDTVKHTEAEVWAILWKAAKDAYEDYKNEHSDPVLDEDEEFYMVGEVYNYFVKEGRKFNYGDKEVDFFEHGFKHLINFDFKSDAHKDYEFIFKKYDRILNDELSGKGVLNYISSHDDGGPFDLERTRPIEAGTKLLLCPGGVQIYYGDETARSLTVDAEGDARLRSFMNWDDITDEEVIGTYSRMEILEHWQKLGRFKRDNPSVGAGRHTQLSAEPYIFKRELITLEEENKVVVGLDLDIGKKEVLVKGVFAEGAIVSDAYGDVQGVVRDGKVSLDTPYNIVLLQSSSDQSDHQ